MQRCWYRIPYSIYSHMAFRNAQPRQWQGERTMSLTQSRGLTDAGRWTAVATALVDHLDSLENAQQRGATVPPPPAGAIEAARRFFDFVLNGIALDQKRSGVSSSASGPRPSQATAAGISNLSIAVKVIRSEKHNASADDLEQVGREIRFLLNSL